MTIPNKTDKVIKMYLDSPHHGTWIWERENGTFYAQCRYDEITYYEVHQENNRWVFDEQINE
jgi:hypothetical protein